jgi:hypothetical protein
MFVIEHILQEQERFQVLDHCHHQHQSLSIGQGQHLPKLMQRLTLGIASA